MVEPWGTMEALDCWGLEGGLEFDLTGGELLSFVRDGFENTSA